MAVNDEPILVNHDFPLAVIPAPMFGQEWKNPLHPVGEDPLDPTPAVLGANLYIDSDDIQLTQVSCVPGRSITA